jgi:hypothetical protein
MRKITNWKARENVSAISLPEHLAPDVSWGRWLAALQEGIKERRKLLKKILRQEHRDTLNEVRDRCCSRMERPGEKEIQRLLGNRIESHPAETRSSKNRQKRHPDTICAKLSDSKWESWITSMGGKALWQCVTRLRSNALHEDCSDRVECWHGRDMTVENSVTSATEMQMRLSPMSKVTNCMETSPSPVRESLLRWPVRKHRS